MMSSTSRRPAATNWFENVSRYSVIKMLPPPATRLSTPNSPPPPPIWVEPVIHDSSPLSEKTLSLG
jgi:hypothetical protein